MNILNQISNVIPFSKKELLILRLVMSFAAIVSLGLGILYHFTSPDINPWFIPRIIISILCILIVIVSLSKYKTHTLFTITNYVFFNFLMAWAIYLCYSNGFKINGAFGLMITFIWGCFLFKNRFWLNTYIIYTIILIAIFSQKAISTEVNPYILISYFVIAGILVALIFNNKIAHDRKILLLNSQLENANKNLEEKVEERTKSIIEKNKKLERFTFITSHSLQEPLRTMSIYSKMLEKDYQEKLDKKGLKITSFIHHSSNRMSSIISELHQYELIGKETTKEKIDINHLLEKLQEDLNQLITETNTTITIQKDISTIVGVNIYIKILFQNLIENAIKYRSQQNPLIEIKSKEKENYIEFSIKDNGIGIAATKKERIFNIFEKLHLRENYKGNGIGLSYCKKIVEIHEGNIWLESEKGEGTTFYFTIKK